MESMTGRPSPLTKAPASRKLSQRNSDHKGQDITPVALRVTSIFRPEEGTWKVVHRHADPITTVQAPE